MGNDFFAKPREHSKIKASIVAAYFVAWARVIVRSAKKNGKTPRLTYIDLFSGPGKYADGTPSTPLLVLGAAIKHAEIRDSVIMVFNDYSAKYVRILTTEIENTPGIETLRHPPQVYNYCVDKDITSLVEHDGTMPAFLFVDPYGYKGLSLDLVKSVIRRWGSDCVFFFNYRRINMNLPTQKPVLRETLMCDLFGAQRFERLRADIDQVLDPETRERTIIGHLRDALGDIGGKYVLTYAVADMRGKRTQQYLIYVTKSAKGLTIMKDTMGNLSTEELMCCSEFGYNPVMESQTTLLKELCPPEDALADALSEHFAGRSVRADQVYSEHGTTTNFRERDYKRALKKLESENRIAVDPPADKRRRDTLSDDVRITFPKLG
jgi:three-Cys-motif partner protein